MRIKQLHIKDFRHIKNIDINFGDTLTVISGLNGTGKSSILGLIGHLFSFRGDNNKIEHRTLAGKPFDTKYSDIFRFDKSYDFSGNYIYNAVLQSDSDIEEFIYGHSEYVKKEKRFRMYVGLNEIEHGNKKKYPVIYLGLSRLFPLAQESDKKNIELINDDDDDDSLNVKIGESLLSKTNKDELAANTKNILTIMDNTTSTEHINTPHKEYESIKTDKYGALGLSAGQDNIGQILTALISFKTLNSGGIFLIDELEATLFPAAQINLVKQLYKYAKAFNLQIIFTTHSLEVIKEVLNFGNSEETKNDVVINFLETVDREVKNTITKDIKHIQNRVLLEVGEKPKINKMTVLCEDKTGYYWCKFLLNGDKYLKEHCDVVCGLGDGVIRNLAKTGLKCFDNFIFVLDGDLENSYKDIKINNLCFLPGSKSPETEMYNFLNSLPESDKFWGNNYFFKNTCFNGYVDSKKESQHKDWLEKRCKGNLGQGYKLFFNRWKSDNNTKISEFQNKLTSIIKKHY